MLFRFPLKPSQTFPKWSLQFVGSLMSSGQMATSGLRHAITFLLLLLV